MRQGFLAQKLRDGFRRPSSTASDSYRAWTLVACSPFGPFSTVKLTG